MRILIPEVADVDTQAQLRLLARDLVPQGAASTFFPPLPPRHRGWQQAYELASLIVTGLGLNLDVGVLTGPGFVVSTWSAWEFLCEEFVRRALPDCKIVSQKQWVLGHRGAEEVYAKPNISPVTKGGVPFLLDAKYKARAGKSPRIDAGDLYESLAFLRAGQTDLMCLLYPSVRPPDQLALGEWQLFDQVNIGLQTIQGFEVQIQGLARRGGFEELVAGACSLLNSKLGIAAVQ